MYEDKQENNPEIIWFQRLIRQEEVGFTFDVEYARKLLKIILRRIKNDKVR